MMTDTDSRLETAVKDRNKLIADIQRIEGRLEAAESGLAQAESECREKGIEPEQIGVALEKLNERYIKLVDSFEADVQTARQALAPYREDTDENRGS